jgi:hypothetical protein
VLLLSASCSSSSPGSATSSSVVPSATSPSPSASPSPCLDRSRFQTQIVQVDTLLSDAIKALQKFDLNSAASDFNAAADLTETMATNAETLVPEAAGEIRAAEARLRSVATELSQGATDASAITTTSIPLPRTSKPRSKPLTSLQMSVDRGAILRNCGVIVWTRSDHSDAREMRGGERGMAVRPGTEMGWSEPAPSLAPYFKAAAFIHSID